LENGLVGPAGEHYVLDQLYRRGILAGLAPPGTPDVDILVLPPDRGVTVQVKTRIGATGRPSWPMNPKHETLVDERMFYAFVDLGQEPPVTWIVPSAMVAEVLRENHVAWLAAPGRGGRAHRDNKMRQLRNEYPPEDQPPSYPAGWLDQCRERWDLLGSGE
jgi:hypothetical protein